MKTVFINLQEGDIKSAQEIPINSIITIDKSFIDMMDYIDDAALGVLLQLQHYQPINTLHLTDITPYVLLYFDDDLNYQGAAYSLKSASGPFTIQTPYKTLLFLRLPHDLKLNHIQNLSYDAH